MAKAREDLTNFSDCILGYHRSNALESLSARHTAVSLSRGSNSSRSERSLSPLNLSENPLSSFRTHGTIPLIDERILLTGSSQLCIILPSEPHLLESTPRGLLLTLLVALHPQELHDFAHTSGESRLGDRIVLFSGAESHGERSFGFETGFYGFWRLVLVVLILDLHLLEIRLRDLGVAGTGGVQAVTSAGVQIAESGMLDRAVSAEQLVGVNDWSRKKLSEMFGGRNPGFSSHSDLPDEFLAELSFGSGDFRADEGHGFELAGNAGWDGLIDDPVVQRMEDVFCSVAWKNCQCIHINLMVSERTYRWRPRKDAYSC